MVVEMSAAVKAVKAVVLTEVEPVEVVAPAVGLAVMRVAAVVLKEAREVMAAEEEQVPAMVVVERGQERSGREVVVTAPGSAAMAEGVATVMETAAVLEAETAVAMEVAVMARFQSVSSESELQQRRH